MPGRNDNQLSFQCESNTLYIRRQGVLHFELTLWPRPMAYRCMSLVRKERFYPKFRVVGYPYRPRKPKADPQLTLLDVEPAREGAMTKQEAYERLRSSLPFKYAISLAPFRSHQWNVLILLSMKRRFYDLLKSNPVLAYLIANDRTLMRRIFEKQLMMDTLTGMKQAELLKLLQIPDSKAAVKLLRKIAPASASPEDIHTLRHCAASPETMQQLAHIKDVNMGVLGLVRGPRECLPFITQGLLEEAGLDRRNRRYPVTAVVFQRTFHLHYVCYPDRRFPEIKSIEQLNRYYEEVAKFYELAPRQPLPQFPAPPFPGTDDIVPLTTAVELLQEGNNQHHCAGYHHAELCAAGQSYCYRVLKPERATLHLMKSDNGSWFVCELRGPCNQQVCPETIAAVETWLSAEALGIG
jgi:hypothetical protein